MANLDLDYFEYVITYNCLCPGNEEYVASCIDYLKPELFDNSDSREVISILSDHYLRTEHIPSLPEIKARLTSSELRRSFVKMVKTRFSEFKKESFHPVELVRNTEAFLQQKIMKQSTEQSIVELKETGVIDMERMHQDLQNAIQISLFDNLGLDFMTDVDAFCEELIREDRFISTGFPQLDKELSGGSFEEGKAIYGVAGETNVGKSIVLANLGANAIMDGRNVVVISLEMSEFRYGLRYASLLTGRGAGTLKVDPTALKQWVGEFDLGNRLFIKEFPCRAITINTIRAYLKKLRRVKGFKPDVIMVDYHTLLNPTVQQQSRHLDLQYVTQETRGLSYDMECPIWSALQLNRPPKEFEGSPDRDRIASSWDMLADMDFVVNIWQTKTMRELSRLGWILRKSRDGTRDIEHIWGIDYNLLKIREVDEDELLQVDKEEMENREGLLEDVANQYKSRFAQEVV